MKIFFLGLTLLSSLASAQTDYQFFEPNVVDLDIRAVYPTGAEGINWANCRKYYSCARWVQASINEFRSPKGLQRNPSEFRYVVRAFRFAIQGRRSGDGRVYRVKVVDRGSISVSKPSERTGGMKNMVLRCTDKVWSDQTYPPIIWAINGQSAVAQDIPHNRLDVEGELEGNWTITDSDCPSNTFRVDVTYRFSGEAKFDEYFSLTILDR